MNVNLKSCPACNSRLEVSEYHCPVCDTTIRGHFAGSDFAGLSAAQLEFVKVFLCVQGNFKEVEKALSISYPTVKNRLAEITRQICGKEPEGRGSVLSDLEAGNISVEEAIKKLQS